jgi:phosphatidylethanolamine/phosphatidyl-N-methylethanolamine N-methyltransferase
VARGSFLSGILAKPRHTGAIAPSSRFLAQRIIQDANLGPLDTVIEIGPGTGALTRPILEQLKDPTQYFGVEINAGFVKHLRAKMPAASIHQGSAEDLASVYAAHRAELDRMSRGQVAQGAEAAPAVEFAPSQACARRIIASLPWTILPVELQKSILAAAATTLTPDGTFTTFIYAHARGLFPSARAFCGLLGDRFEEVVESPIVWRNLPPAIVISAHRPRGAR